MKYHPGRRENVPAPGNRSQLAQANNVSEAGAVLGSNTASSQVASRQFIRRYQWLIGIFFLIYFLYLLYLQTRSDVAANSGRWLRVISDIPVILGALICTCVCVYVFMKFSALRRNAADINVRRAWLAVACLGCAAAVYTIGQAIWTGYEAFYPGPQVPYPAIHDFFYLAVYPFSWAGIALLIPQRSTAAGRVRLLLDATTAVVSFLAISWYFILGPTIASLNGGWLEKFVSLAYPLGDLSLCVAAAILLFGTSSSSSFSAVIGRLGLGVTILAATDSLYGYAQLQGFYHTGLLQDVGWPMSWLFIGLALLTFLHNSSNISNQRQPASAGTQHLHRTGAAIRAIAPMVIAFLTCALLLMAVIIRQTAPLIQIVFVCAGLFLLPIIRQALTLIDNLLLNERLRVALDQSQQAFQQSQQELLTTMSQAELYEELRTGIQNLQDVHAALARGDMSARARVEGPLSPVAHSLNLLVERINRWSQVFQQNKIMENEARLLVSELESLGEGKSVTPTSTKPSSLPTGVALVGITRLQKRLQWRFRRLQEAMGLLSSRVNTLSDVTAQLRHALGSRTISQQQTEQMMTLLERGLANNQEVLRELQQQTAIYLESSSEADLISTNKPLK